MRKRTAGKTGGLIVLVLAASSGAVAEDAKPAARPAADMVNGIDPYEPLPPILTLDKTVELFRKRGFALLIADGNVETAEGALKSAAQFANPTFNAGYGHSFGAYVGPSGTSANYYTVGVTDNAAALDTLFVGKRGLRIEVAKDALDSTRYTRTDTERTMVAAVKQAWVAVAAAKKQLDINRDLLKSNQDTEALIEVRYKAGSASLVDLAMQKSATYEAAQQVALALASYEQGKVALAFLLGDRARTAPAWDVDASLFDHDPPKQVIDATPESLRKVADDHRPDVLAQKLQIASAEAAIRLTRRQIFPDISLGLNYSMEGVGQNAVSPPTLEFDVSVTPPIFYRLEGELQEAEANLKIQEVTLAQTEAQVASDIDTGYSALKSAHDRLDRLNHGYLEQSKLQYDLSKVQYDKGLISLVDLLVAQRTYVATVSEWVQALNDIWTAIFMIEAAAATEFKS